LKYFYENKPSIKIIEKNDWMTDKIVYQHNNDGMNSVKNYQVVKPDYVKIAIQAIRKADPMAIIVLNDYYLENNSVKNKKMIDFTFQLLKDEVLKEGDIIGIEGHRSILENGITSDQIKDALRPFIEMDLRGRITELDAFDVFSNDAVSQKAKADLYMKYIRAAVELNAEYRAKGRNTDVVDAVVILATTHSESWQHFETKYQNTKIYPALFSDEGDYELAYYLISRDLIELNNNL
jgi:GH35 family endo-1,4-beta-xylanase